MIKKYFLLAICIALLLFKDANGQNDTYQFPPDGMQSPTAASLGKFGDIPVSLYTGTPNITIPLHKTEGNKLSLPIQLKYHASGIKVREIAGWVGLGWALDAGGVITRTVRGIPDEITHGYLDTQHRLKELVENPSNLLDVIKDIKSEQIDPEPDLFHFNFAGYSGQFLLTNEGMTDTHVYGKPIEDTKIRIEWKNPNDSSTDNKFIITVEDGTRFIFSEREVVREWSDLSWHDRTPYEASWYLTEIVSPQSQEVIQIRYTIDRSTYQFEQDMVSKAIEEIDCVHTGSVYPREIGDHYSSFHQIIRQPILKEIITSKETIVFSSDYQRNDPGKTKLNVIKVLRNGATSKKFKLNYSYNNPNASMKSHRRLMLDSVTEIGKNGEEKPPYEFFYDERALPDRLSYGIDHWGYYNGKEINETLIPKYKGLPGGDRTPSFPEMRAGSLTKISYPTGGATKFHYEPHSYKWIGSQELSEETFYKTKTASATAGPHPVEPVLDDVKNFTIPYRQEVKISYRLTCYDPEFCEGAPTSVVLKDDNNNVIEQFSLSGGDTSEGDSYFEFYKYMDPGEYTLEAHAFEYNNPDTGEKKYTYCDIDVDYKIEETRDVKQEKKVGGLRVAKIIDIPKTGSPNVREFKYTMIDEPIKSSGVLVNKPVNYYKGIVDLVTDGDMSIIEYGCAVEFRLSNSIIPLGSTQGSHIGYQYVTTTYQEAGSKIEKFITPYSKPDILPMNGDWQRPGRQISKDWQRGNIVEERIRQQDGSLLKKVNYDYEEKILTNSGRWDVINEVPSYPIIHFSQFNNNKYTPYFGDTSYLYLISKLTIDRGVKFKSEKKITSYNTNKSISTNYSENYFYNTNSSDPSFGQLKKLTKTNSDGSQRVTTYEYAHEQYSGMEAAHMLSQPYKVTTTDGDGKTLNINWTLWNEFDTNDDGSPDYWQSCGQWIGGVELSTTDPAGC